MKSLSLALFITALFAIHASAQIAQSITPHFKAWLEANGYGDLKFERADIAGGSYGGKTDDSDQVTREPVIFFHGNSDHAVGIESDKFNGFTNSISFFLSQGYKTSELYITTWGPANSKVASQQTHSYEYLNYLRKFTEAVLKYTGAKKVDIIGHSMGVTLSRKVIRGGKLVHDGITHQLGDSLASNVDTFLGIAGANLGLVTCYTAFTLPTCHKSNGFYPGIGEGPVELSNYLADLYHNEEKEGDYVFTMLSTADDLILYGDKVWGKYTSQIKYEDGSKIYHNLGHMQLKTDTFQEQLQIITQHSI